MADFMDSLAALIEGFEGYSATPYQDGAGVWTIGFGHTKGVTKDTPPVTRGLAIHMLQEDMQDAIDAVDDFLEVDLNDNQMAALVSIVFNAGTGVLKGHLGSYINAGDFEAAAEQFDVWVYITRSDGTKEKSNGLVARREAEKELFLTPVAAD